MFFDSHEIAAGWDNEAGVVNLETYFKYPLRPVSRVPLGSVTRTTLDRKRHTNGRRLVTLEQAGDPAGYTPFDELDDFITDFFGDWEPTDESVQVTIGIRGIDNTFHYYNAYLHYPREGEHYEYINTAFVSGLRLDFDIVEDL